MESEMKTNASASPRRPQTLRCLHKQAGLTLIEAVLAVLVLVAVITIGLGLYYGMTGSIQVVESANNATQFAGNIQRTYRNEGAFTNVRSTSSAVINAAPNRLVSGGNLMHEWGGDISISSQMSGGAFSIEYEAVPEDACSDFVNTVSGTFYRIDVDGTTVKDLTAGTEMTADGVQNACQGSGSVDIEMFAGRG